MTLVNFDVEITPEVSLQTDNVTVIVGTAQDPPENCAVTCHGHYLLTM